MAIKKYKRTIKIPSIPEVDKKFIEEYPETHRVLMAMKEQLEVYEKRGSHDDSVVKFKDLDLSKQWTSTSITTQSVSPSTTINTVQDFLSLQGSSGLATGGDITDNGDQTFTVAKGTGWIRNANQHDATLLACNWNESADIAIADGTLYFVYVDYNNGQPIISTTETRDDITGHDSFEIGRVVREGTTLHIQYNPDLVVHGIGHVTERFRHQVGIQRASGIILSETGTRNITVTAGEIYAKLNEYDTAAIDTSATDTFDSYLTNTLSSSGNTQWDNQNYDNAGVLTAMTVGRYGNLWFFMEADGGLVCVYGTSNAATQSVAETESAPTVLPKRLQEQGGILIARLTYQKSASSAAAIVNPFTTSFTAASASDHGNLAGLADDDHSQYLLASQATDRGTFTTNWADLTDSGATTLHKHDHGGMDGLGDDDHSQYLLVDGTRAMAGDLDLDSNDANNINAIQFDTAPTHSQSEGSLYWNGTDHTLNIDTEKTGVILQVGQEILTRARATENISNGDIVCVVGAQGDRPAVAIADADLATAHKTLGMATHDITSGTDGYICRLGFVRDLDTSSYSAGDMIYLSQVGTTGNTWTSTAPSTPAHAVVIGMIIKVSATEGILCVNLTKYPDLNNVDDVLIASAADGELLVYDSALAYWKNSSVVGTLTAGNISFAGQLAFPSIQNTSTDVNTLDDYEEGTWTPVIGGASGTSGQSYATQGGTYTKIGHRVFATGIAFLSAKGTITGTLVISGLPFACASGTDEYSTATFGSCKYWSLSSGHVLQGYIGAGASYITLNETDFNNDNVSLLATSNVGNSTGVIVSVSYIAA